MGARMNRKSKRSYKVLRTMCGISQDGGRPMTPPPTPNQQPMCDEAGTSQEAARFFTVEWVADSDKPPMVISEEQKTWRIEKWREEYVTKLAELKQTNLKSMDKIILTAIHCLENNYGPRMIGGSLSNFRSLLREILHQALFNVDIYELLKNLQTKSTLDLAAKLEYQTKLKNDALQSYEKLQKQFEDQTKEGIFADLTAKLDCSRAMEETLRKELNDSCKRAESLEAKLDQAQEMINRLKSDLATKQKVLSKTDEKKKLEKLQEENGRLKDIQSNQSITNKKYKVEMESLHDQIKTKSSELAEVRSLLEEKVKMIDTIKREGNTLEFSEDQVLIMKEQELKDLLKKLEDPVEAAENQEKVEKLMSDPKTSKRKQGRIELQYRKHIEIKEIAVERIKRNLKALDKHFSFNITSLVEVPEVPPAFEEATKVCGFCKKILIDEVDTYTSCEQCDNQWHMQCFDEWMDENDSCTPDHKATIHRRTGKLQGKKKK